MHWSWWFMLPIGTVYLVGVWMGNGFLRVGNIQWYERPVVWFWPVALPLIFVGGLLREIFWAL